MNKLSNELMAMKKVKDLKKSRVNKENIFPHFGE